MSSTAVMVGLTLATMFATGTWMVLVELRLFRRTTLKSRLLPYSGAVRGRSAAGNASSDGPAGHVVASFADQLAMPFGQMVSGAAGIRSDLGRRLTRAGLRTSPAVFRRRQFLGTVAALGCSVVVVATLVPSAVVTAALLGAPALVALGEEQRLQALISRRAAAIDTELPVVAEQIGILLGAGLSLRATLSRVCQRGHGVVAEELATVVRSIRHGRTENEALRSWAETIALDGVDRLVSVLALHREATDLGALISEEAQALRAEAHRRLVASIERRAQLVWVPVTVATLVPGLVLIGVPFVSAVGGVTG